MVFKSLPPRKICSHTLRTLLRQLWQQMRPITARSTINNSSTHPPSKPIKARSDARDTALIRVATLARCLDSQRILFQKKIVANRPTERRARIFWSCQICAMCLRSRSWRGILTSISQRTSGQHISQPLRSDRLRRTSPVAFIKRRASCSRSNRLGFVSAAIPRTYLHLSTEKMRWLIISYDHIALLFIIQILSSYNRLLILR